MTVTPPERIKVSNTTGKTRPIAFRVPVKVYDIILRRVEKHPRARTVGQYSKEQIIFHVTRKHGK